MRLDADFVSRQWLPGLVARHLPSDEYDVVLRAGGDGAPILFARAPGGTDEVLAEADARAQLLKLDSGEPGRSHEHVNVPGGPGQRADDGARAHPRRLRVLLEHSAREDPERVTRLVQTLAERGWQLRVKHRAGSLAAAAAAIRRQNLLLGYGVLLLLAASLGLVLSSARAARRLARQQIEFVAGVSHELRTPISVVRAMSANLADGVVRGDEQVALYGRHLQQHSRRLGDLVERTLEYAGIASGRRRYESSAVDVAELVRQATSACELSASGSRVDVDVPPDLPQLRGDAPALLSALRNLIDNALRYSPCHQRVTVEVRRTGPQLAISVSDRGPGIEPEDLPHLFEPFYRGRNAVRDSTPGVGIGLALARQIADAHGGRLEVRSEPGTGSRFCLILPIGETA